MVVPEEPVGHARQVVGDHPFEGRGPDSASEVGRQVLGPGPVVMKEVGEEACAGGGGGDDAGVAVEPLVKDGLQLPELGLASRRESGEWGPVERRLGAQVRIVRAGGGDPALGLGDQGGHEIGDDTAQERAHRDAPAVAAKGPVPRPVAAEERGGFEVPNLDQARREAVLHVMGAVGDLVGEVGELRLDRRRPEAGEVLRHEADPPGVGEHAVAGLPGQVEPGTIGVGALEFIHDPVGLQVVLESAVVGHELVEGVLSGVAEGRVPEVVGQRDGLAEVLVQAQDPRESPGDLGDFQRVRESGPKVVSLVVDEDLRFVLEAPEGARVNDPVPVALEDGAERVGRFGSPPSRGSGGAARRGTEVGGLRLIEERW